MSKYVMFVDSDDYIEPNIIKRMLYSAEKNNAGLVVEGYKKVTDDSKVLFEESYQTEIFEKEDVKNIFMARMIGSCPERKDSIFTTVCSKLYRLDIMKNSGVLFHSERVIQSEDLAFQLDFVPFIEKVVVTNDSGYFYRSNLHSLTTKYKENRFEETKKVFIYIKNKIIDLNMPANTIYRADKMLFVHADGAIKQEIPSRNKKSAYESIKKIREIIRSIAAE